MSQVIFDIETIGKPFDSLPQAVQDSLLKNASTDEEREEIKSMLALSPHTGEIVAIGMLNPATGKGAVYFQDAGKGTQAFTENGIAYTACDEANIIERFWATVKQYRQVVTFNGRSFDAPYIAVRSAVHKIPPTKNLMPPRFTTDTHLDLMDQLTYYGATRRSSLDVWCHTLGIKSPKQNGIDGSKVQEHYQNGKYADIARYCAEDLYATASLLQTWECYIQYPPAQQKDGPQQNIPGTR
jgi:predicted PolB exonuclease-like 3'-5' exonuclease